MTTIYVPRQEPIDGSALSGIDGAANRTYVLSYDNAVFAGMTIRVSGENLTPTTDFTLDTGTNTITIIGSTDDVDALVISYDVASQVSFAGTTNEAIRYMLVGENNTTLLTDDMVSLHWEQVAELQSSTDVTAKRYYACYIIALNWQGLGFVTRVDGVSFVLPDAKEYLRLYNTRIKKINSTVSGRSEGWAKVSTNRGFVYDSSTRFLKRRL